MDAPAPVRVVHVEAGSPLPEISPWRSDGVRYGAALIFVRRGGVPIGQRRVELNGSVLPATELAERLNGLWERATPARPSQPIADAPLISVVVPSVMQRTEQLRRCVAALSAIDYPSFEVIVVDNRPEETPERAALHGELTAHRRVRVVCEPVPGSSAARNRGIAVASGEIIAFTDDDTEADPGWLAALARRFRDEPQTDCVTGLMLPAELETPSQIWFEASGSKIGNEYAVVTYQPDGRNPYVVRAERAGRPPERVEIYRGVFGMSVNMAFRAAALAELGGFNEALGAGTPAHGGEDLEIVSRLLYRGGRLTTDPAAVIKHYHRNDYPGLRRQMYGYGVGYTAALAALVAADTRHLAGIGRLARSVVPVVRRRAHTRTAQYPSGLRWVERWGLLVGPLAYLRSRRARNGWAGR